MGRGLGPSCGWKRQSAGKNLLRLPRDATEDNIQEEQAADRAAAKKRLEEDDASVQHFRKRRFLLILMGLFLVLGIFIGSMLALLTQIGVSAASTTTTTSSTNSNPNPNQNPLKGGSGNSKKGGATLSSSSGSLLNSGYSGLPRITATNMTGNGTEGSGSGLLNAQVEIPDEKDARFCVLSYDQVKRLNDLMSEVINIHGLGNWATIDVRLSDLVSVAK